VEWNYQIPSPQVLIGGKNLTGSTIRDLVILAIVLPAASKISFMGQGAAIAGRCGNLFGHSRSRSGSRSRRKVAVEEPGLMYLLTNCRRNSPGKVFSCLHPISAEVFE
jgi:hypothetical protein